MIVSVLRTKPGTVYAAGLSEAFRSKGQRAMFPAYRFFEVTDAVAQGAVLPALASDLDALFMSGSVTTGSDGRARLDWSALKLKAPPTSLPRIVVVGKALPWSLDGEPTATGVTVYVEQQKATPSALLKITVLEAGGQAAPNVRLLWEVTA